MLPGSRVDARGTRVATPLPRRAAILVAALGLLWGCGDPAEPPVEEVSAVVVFTMNPAGTPESEGREVFVIRADGSDETRLTTGAGATAASWSPDGARIAFGSAPQFGGDGQVHVMNADGSGRQAVTSAPGTYASPAWSPGGDRIVLVRTGDPGSLVVVDADGSNGRTLVECPYTCAWPAWSPDGSTVAVVVWAPLASPSTFSPLVYLVDVDAPEVQPLPGGFEYGHLPAWAPDGTLLFVGRRDDPNHAFYRTTTQGQVLERFDLDGTARSSPSLSSDGRGLLYFQHGSPSRIMLRDLATGAESVVREWAEAKNSFATPHLRP